MIKVFGKFPQNLEKIINFTLCKQDFPQIIKTNAFDYSLRMKKSSNSTFVSISYSTNKNKSIFDFFFFFYFGFQILFFIRF